MGEGGDFAYKCAVRNSLGQKKSASSVAAFSAGSSTSAAALPKFEAAQIASVCPTSPSPKVISASAKAASVIEKTAEATKSTAEAAL